MLLTSCSSVSVRDYANDKPTLKLEEYLSGDFEAWGMFQNRKGLVSRRFHCRIKATWKDGVGILDEDFTWSDGTKSKRVWTLKKVAENRYVGTASDVVGEAIGEVAGNAFHWKYKLDLEVDGETYRVDFDDWMYLMDDKVMLNRSRMSKWGIYLGEVTLTFVKP